MSSTPSRRLRQVLREDERLVWHSKPHRRAFYAGWLIAVPALLVFAGPLLGFAGYVTIWPELAATLGGLLSPAAWIGVGLGVLALAALAAHALLGRAHRLKEYGLTDDRLVVLSGFYGRDATTLSLEDVVDIDVQKSLVDKLFGTGWIQVRTAGSSLSLTFVPEPLEVLDTIETASGEGQAASSTSPEPSRQRAGSPDVG